MSLAPAGWPEPPTTTLKDPRETAPNETPSKINMKAASMLAKGKPITLGDFFQSHLSALNQPTRPFNPTRLQLPLTRWNPIAAASSTTPTLSIKKGIPVQQHQRSTHAAKGKNVAPDDPNFPPLPLRQDPSTSAEDGNVRSAPLLDISGQTPASKSYREAVSAPWAQSIDVSLPPVPAIALSTHLGEPAVIISKEDEMKLAMSFQFALIGKFTRGRPFMASIRKSILAAGFQGECHVGLIDYRHVIFQFQMQSDFQRLWLKKTWNFDGFYAKIFRWTPAFSPDKETSIVPVWVNFPLLPVHLCTKDMLQAIGSAIGNPLKLDLATAAMTRVLRPSEARLCIEVDLLKPLPQRVWIGTEEEGKWQSIQYENLPAFCTKCSMLGHTNSSCKTKKSVPSTKMWMPKKTPGDMGKAMNVQDLNSDPSSFREHGGKVGEPQVTTNPNGGRDSFEEKGRPEIEPSSLNPVNSALAIVSLPEAARMFKPQEYELLHFLFNLGRLLDTINSQGKEAELSAPPPQTVVLAELGELQEKPLANEVSLEARNTPVLEANSTRDMEGSNEPRHWEEGESSGRYKYSHNDELAILQGMETLIWDEGKFSSIQDVSSTSGLALLKALNVETEMEEGREDCWSDGVDRWTETSYDEDQQDELEDLIDKMERNQKPAKQTRTMEALVSPKMSGRRLRDRNPFFSYSETRRWKRR